MTEQAQTTSEKTYLTVSGYFFVIKKEFLFQDDFTSEFCNDKIVATCLSTQKEAETFKRLLSKEGLSEGKEYVQGICSSEQVLDHSPNSWLEFRFKEDKWEVCWLGAVSRN